MAIISVVNWTPSELWFFNFLLTCYLKAIDTKEDLPLYQNEHLYNVHVLLTAFSWSSQWAFLCNMSTLQRCSFIDIIKVYVFFSQKIWHFPSVLVSWLFSINLLEMKYFLLSTHTCHTSKVAFLNVDYRYELHF